MKDITMKRILRYALSVFICLFLVANVLSNEARAETGYLLVSAGTGNAANIASTNSDPANPVNWNKFFFYNTEYNGITRYSINGTGNWNLLFANDAASTTFTITSGGTGTGTVAYNKAAKTIDWYFSNAVITSSSFTVTYSSNILNDVTMSAPGGIWQYESTAALGVTNPVGVALGSAAEVQRCCTVGVNWYILSSVSKNVRNNYSTSYGGGLVNVTIDKTGATISTKIEIRNETAQKFIQTGFDTTGFSYSYLYDKGLILNMSLVSGDYDYVVVNSSGCVSTCFSVPTVTPTPDPVTGVGIVFDASTYVIGATANISWIRTDPTPFGYQDDIYLVQPSTTGTVKKILISSPPNTGYVKTNDLPVPGTYNVSFERSLFGFGFSPEILATDSAVVSAEQASYIIVNATVPVGVYTEGIYLYGWNGTGRIVIYQDLSDGTVKEIDSLAINATCCVEHTVPQLFFPEPGNYRVVLMKGYSEVKAVASVVAYLSDIVPGANITVSNISVDKSQYTYGEPYTITYQVDSFNYSNKAKRIIAYEVATGANTLVNIVPAQTGSITRTFDSEMFPFSGALQFRLMGLNASGDYLLASVNFTLSKIDTEGYGLDVTKSPICIKETGYFTYYSPSAATVSISDRDVTVYSKNLTSAVSGKTVPFTINRAGNYEIFLRPANETDVKFTKIIEVKACDVSAQAPVSGPNQAKQVAEMITTPIFWALLVTAGLVIAIAWKTKDGFAAGSVGMISAGVFAFMSWLPLWIFFSTLIIAALLLSSSLVAKQLKKTG